MEVKRKECSDYHFGDEEKRNREKVDDWKSFVKNSTVVSSTTKQGDKKQTLDDGSRNPFTKQHKNTDLKSKEIPKKPHFDEKRDASASTKQLHKLIKIKYKDGTVALKSVS